jgi:8-oxo-dGTP pyrophosphatase MutT (NUDIX family)
MSAGDTIDRLRAALAGRVRDVIPLADLPDHRPAAVLAPLVVRDDDLRLLFTLRPTTLRSHSGQVSFPGGKVDAVDADLGATALREAEEELGIPRAHVQMIGQLDDVPTPSGYVITPYVGLITPAPEAYTPNPAEVAEAFEIPLTTLRDPTIFEDHGDVERWGRKFKLCRFRPNGRDIWGATARMVWQMLQLV